MKLRILLVAATAMAVLAGCGVLGYDAYVGTWVYEYETVDELGNPAIIQDRLELSESAFVLTTVDTAASTWSGSRGDLVVVGNTLYFTAKEIGFDLNTMGDIVALFGFAGVDFGLAVQEWYPIDDFFNEMAKLPSDIIDREPYDLERSTFTIEDDVMRLSIDPVATFERVQ